MALDARDIDVLAATHGAAMHRFVPGLGLDDDHADDCVQEALARLLAHSDRPLGHDYDMMAFEAMMPS